jgi:hypothetical protein
VIHHRCWNGHSTVESAAQSAAQLSAKCQIKRHTCSLELLDIAFETAVIIFCKPTFLVGFSTASFSTAVADL